MKRKMAIDEKDEVLEREAVNEWISDADLEKVEKMDEDEKRGEIQKMKEAKESDHLKAETCDRLGALRTVAEKHMARKESVTVKLDAIVPKRSRVVCDPVVINVETANQSPEMKDPKAFGKSFPLRTFSFGQTEIESPPFNL